MGIAARNLQITDLTGAGLPDMLFTSAGNGDALSVEVFVGAKPAASTKASTTTTLQASSDSITAGQSVTFTATVAGASGRPTGTVTFIDGTTSLGTGALSGGVATYTTTSLAVGSHSVTAKYGGDTNFTGSTSSAVEGSASA